jgi:hypothetical protein
MEKNFYPFNYNGAIIRENKAILKHNMFGHYCGYVAIKKSLIPKKWWGNYNADALQYLNIHGGLTYGRLEGNWCIFGFDTMHAGDEENFKLRNENYIWKMVDQMEQQIMDYAKNYKKWKAFKTKKDRIKLIERIIKKGAIKEEMGFSAMIGCLAGGQEFEN